MAEHLTRLAVADKLPLWWCRWARPDRRNWNSAGTVSGLACQLARHGRLGLRLPSRASCRSSTSRRPSRSAVRARHFDGDAVDRRQCRLGSGYDDIFEHGRHGTYAVLRACHRFGRRWWRCAAFRMATARSARRRLDAISAIIDVQAGRGRGPAGSCSGGRFAGVVDRGRLRFRKA